MVDISLSSQVGHSSSRDIAFGFRFDYVATTLASIYPCFMDLNFACEELICFVKSFICTHQVNFSAPTATIPPGPVVRTIQGQKKTLEAQGSSLPPLR